MRSADFVVHDGAGRLIGLITAANDTINLGRDPVGNRLLRDGQVTQSVFDAVNRLLEDEDFTYAYEANGNLETKSEELGGAVTTYTCNAENQLIRIDFPDLNRPPLPHPAKCAR